MLRKLVKIHNIAEKRNVSNGLGYLVFGATCESRNCENNQTLIRHRRQHLKDRIPPPPFIKRVIPSDTPFYRPQQPFYPKRKQNSISVKNVFITLHNSHNLVLLYFFVTKICQKKFWCLCLFVRVVKKVIF